VVNRTGRKNYELTQRDTEAFTEFHREEKEKVMNKGSPKLSRVLCPES
jgi:hypothetical protein